ncbi:MAG: hypothetical protein JXB32_16735 [Deltaproteobacteria bacterium]|nr:hypothetical protein [Deltaproteobacteria bacterium]
MPAEVRGWFDPRGDLMLVERQYVSGPDWCDDPVELDVVRVGSAASAPGFAVE